MTFKPKFLTEAQDAKLDKRQGVRENGPADRKLDKQRGVKEIANRKHNARRAGRGR